MHVFILNRTVNGFPENEARSLAESVFIRRPKEKDAVLYWMSYEDSCCSGG